MSTPNSQNVYNAIAHHLTNPQVLSTEHRLFQDALKTVEKRRKSTGDLPKIFDSLNHARTINDVKVLLQNERASNTIWKEPIGKAWLEIFGKYAEYIWNYKIVLDAVVTRSPTIGAPIWATFSFVINVFKEIGAALEYLENTERTLESSIRRFTRYMQEGVKISADLQDALLTYYEVVIDFAVDVHSDFTSSLTKSVFRVVHRTLPVKLKTFDTRIHHIIDDVDKSANIDSIQGMRSHFTALEGKVDNALVNSPLASSTTLPTALHMIHGLPQLNRNFTGQQQSLRAVWELLNRNIHTGQKRTVIYGMGGIGKTQILLKYAYDHIQAAARPRPYDAIIWINAVNEKSVFATVSAFMKMNGFHASLKDGDEISYNAFHTRLKQYSKHWLLIFDNVNDHKHVLSAIPPGNDGHILFSTRHPFLAGQIASMSDNLEIVPMDKATAIKLVSNLTRSSENVRDRDEAIASDVADFAGGLPLLIEQIVHNAILGRRSLAMTLEDARKRTKLLEQKNLASLHEDDLSLGGLVMQTFDALDSGFPRAGALLKILIYLEPSSIPISLFQDCVGSMQEFFDRKYTYDRGAVDQISGRQFDRTVNLDVPGSSQRGSSRNRFRSLAPFRRSRSSQDMRDHLPIDDVEPASSLRQICAVGTPLGQLFENQLMLDGAFDVLVNAAIIRKLNDRERWLHDRVSEVAKALLAEDKVTNQRMALVAATMVYIASPTPHSGTMSPSHKAAQYLPHTMACHANLKELGILNNCSIGPELSHIIASMLDALGVAITTPFDGNDPQLAKQRADSRAEITQFYQQAYVGYMTGWQRLKYDHNITDDEIAQCIRADRDYEKSRSSYSVEDYANRRQRLGRNAPWRAMQTACRLSNWLEQDPATIERACQYTRIAIDFCVAIFGLNDTDTICLRRDLCHKLQRAGLWQEAYDVGVQNMKDWLGWRPNDRRHNRKIKFKNLWKDYQSFEFALDLSICCMGLVRNNSSTQSRNPSWASEAVMWTEICLRHWQSVYGKDDSRNRELLIRLAQAYEATGDFRAAIYWYGQAVFCVLAYMIWEYETWEDGPGRQNAPPGSEDLIGDVVETFEEAMLRLVGEGEGKLGKLENLDVDLKKFLVAVESRIEMWRGDREKNGIWDPHKELKDKIDEEFEEELRLYELKTYGRSFAVDAVDDEVGQDKENLEAPRVEMSLSKVREADVCSVDVSQVATREAQSETESVPLPCHV